MPNSESLIKSYSESLVSSFFLNRKLSRVLNTIIILIHISHSAHYEITTFAAVIWFVLEWNNNPHGSLNIQNAHKILFIQF